MFWVLIETVLLSTHKYVRVEKQAFSKPSLVNLISKDANLVFLLSDTHWFTLQTSDYEVIIDFSVDLASLATLFKKCNVTMT